MFALRRVALNQSFAFSRCFSKISGTCKWFDAKKGYGFITAADGSGDVFVHQTVIKAEGFRSLAEGEPVEFEVQVDENGRKVAKDVTGPNGANVQGAPRRRPRFGNFQRQPRNDEQQQGEQPQEQQEQQQQQQ